MGASGYTPMGGGKRVGIWQGIAVTIDKGTSPPEPRAGGKSDGKEDCHGITSKNTWTECEKLEEGNKI